MKAEKRTIKLKSEAKSLNQLEYFIEEICDDFKLNDTYFGNINVVLVEAFKNAMIHGNKNNPEKEIEIDFMKTSSGMVFSITDDGDGFNFKSIPEITNDQKETVFPGRGTFLIKSLSDGISYKGKGNILEVNYKITSISFETAVNRIQQLMEYSDKEKSTVKK